MKKVSEELLVRDYLIRYILEGDFFDQEKLPSENFLAEKFHTTRHTVRKVYSTIEELGLLVSKQGVGRFAIKNKPEIQLALTGVSFTQKMKEQNVPLVTKNLGVKKIEGKKLTKIHKRGLKGTIYKISRLRELYDHPACIHHSYLSEDLFPEIKKEGKKITSIHSYYKSKGIEGFTNSPSRLSISMPSLKEQKLLKLASLVPLLVLESELYSKEGELIEIISTIYRSDLFQYVLY